MRKMLAFIWFFMPFFGWAQWMVQYSNPSINFKDVYCITAERVMAVGDHGKILSTTNGGLLWTEQNIGANCDLVKVRFTDEQTGYMLGRLQNDLVLYKTTDGGTNWNNISPKAISIIDFSCTNATNLWKTASGDKLYKSSDGGGSFDLISAQAPVQIIQCIDDFVFYGCLGNLLYKTIDGGFTWTSVGLVDYGGRRAAFHFYNQDAGFVKSGNILYKTIDGGNHFEVVNFINYTALQLFATSESTVWGTPTENTINIPDNPQTFKADLSTGGLVFSEGQPIFSAFYFAAPSIGFGVDLNGRIYKNTTGNLNTLITEVSPQVKLYPNPTSEIVQLQLPTKQAYKISVLDGLGRLIFSETAQGKQQIILEVKAFKSGSYFVLVEGDGKRWVEQLVVR